MRRARMVNIEYRYLAGDDEPWELSNSDIEFALVMMYPLYMFTVSGEPSFELSVVAPVSQTGSSTKSTLTTPDE